MTARLIEAGRAVRTARERLQAALNEHALQEAQIEAELGQLALTRLDYRAAAEHFKAAAALVPASTPLVRADYLNRFGMAAYDAGDYAAAEGALEEALRLRQEALGPDHPDVAQSLNNLAGPYLATGRYAEAELLLKQAIAIDEKALGPEHPDLATRLNNLAVLYQATGRLAGAEPLLERALAIREKALGPEHPDLASNLNNLAMLYRATGRYAEAEPLYQRALAIDEKVLGLEHPTAAESLSNLAALYRDTGRLAEAEQLLRRALAIISRALPPDHPHQALFRENYAALLEALGRGTRNTLLPPIASFQRDVVRGRFLRFQPRITHPPGGARQTRQDRRSAALWGAVPPLYLSVGRQSGLDCRPLTRTSGLFSRAHRFGQLVGGARSRSGIGAYPASASAWCVAPARARARRRWARP